jgi:peptidoglycan/LPS O-acetylase OafA/YrhL
VHPATPTTGREPHIDSLKVIASQLIVLHHFAAYGPLADALEGVTPRLASWFYDYARMAVQVFLVLGGFLAARSLAPNSAARLIAPFRIVLQRFLRLVPAFLAALVLAIVCSQLARYWLLADFIPDAPTWGEFLAHAFLLHGVLDVDSLSAGVWYVAIDFQLFALMAVMLWLGRGWAKTVVVGLMLVSLFYFNRNADFDDWAVYFFGAYGLGAVAYWGARSSRAGWFLLLFAGAVLAALVVDFRGRIVIALFTALILGLTQWHRQTQAGQTHLPSPFSSLLATLGGSSYALFLLHFSVLMLGNALFEKLDSPTASAAIATLLACWLASLGLSILFARWVERPLSRLGRSG